MKHRITSIANASKARQYLNLNTFSAAAFVMLKLNVCSFRSCIKCPPLRLLRLERTQEPSVVAHDLYFQNIGDSRTLEAPEALVSRPRGSNAPEYLVLASVGSWLTDAS